MGALSKLPNIGEKVEEQLNEVGIFDYETLCKVGAQEAWLKIQSIDSSVCIHRLMALEGAICGVKKSELPAEKKAELKNFYHAHKM